MVTSIKSTPSPLALTKLISTMISTFQLCASCVYLACSRVALLSHGWNVIRLQKVAYMWILADYMLRPHFAHTPAHVIRPLRQRSIGAARHASSSSVTSRTIINATSINTPVSLLVLDALSQCVQWAALCVTRADGITLVCIEPTQKNTHLLSQINNVDLIRSAS